MILMDEIRAAVAAAPSHEELFAAFEALLKRLAPGATKVVEEAEPDHESPAPPPAV